MAAVTRAPDLADWLLAHGRSAVDTAEAADLLGVPDDHVRSVWPPPFARTGSSAPAAGCGSPSRPSTAPGAHPQPSTSSTR